MRPTTLLVHVPSKRIKLNVSGVYPMPPLGIAMLAAALRAEAYPVELLDIPGQGWSPSAVEAYLVKNRFDHVGLSANFLALREARRWADLIKAHHPKTIVTLGGRGTIFRPAQLTAYFKSLDLIAEGEGERVVVAIARAIEAWRPPRGIPGTAYVAAGSLEVTPPDPPLNMDDLPRPALDLLPTRDYRIHPPFGAYPPVMIVETARGCPFHCTFCCFGKAYRAQSPARVIQYVEELVHRQGYREIHFVDPTFTLERRRVIEICEGLARLRPRVHWTCKTRCDCVDAELLRAMAQAGCYTISYGVESADDAILNALKKGITVEQIERCLSETRRAGIRAAAYLLVGAPGETDETVARITALLKRAKVDFALFGELFPDPTSEMTGEAIGRGLLDEKKMLDYFLGDGEWLFDEQSLLGLRSDQIRRWLDQAAADFYLRPAYFAARLLDLRSPADFRNLFSGAFHLLADKLGLADTIG